MKLNIRFDPLLPLLEDVDPLKLIFELLIEDIVVPSRVLLEFIILGGLPSMLVLDVLNDREGGLNLRGRGVKLLLDLVPFNQEAIGLLSRLL